jgi:exopolysaccharide production protein ExoQ
VASLVPERHPVVSPARGGVTSRASARAPQKRRRTNRAAAHHQTQWSSNGAAAATARHWHVRRRSGGALSAGSLIPMLDSPRFRSAFATFALFTLLAGDVWRYSITWWGFGVIALAMVVVCVLFLVHERARWSVWRLPYPLIAFVALFTLSISWSFYPGASALGIVVTWMTVAGGVTLALILSRDQFLVALSRALKLILSASLLFELVVSLFIRTPVLPAWVDYGSTTDLPKLLYWSRNELLTGGKIQGIVGNSNLLSMVALLALIAFSIQLARAVAARQRRVTSAAWVAFAVLMIALSRSATILVAVAVLVVVLAFVLSVRWARTVAVKAVVTFAYLGVIVSGIVVAVANSSAIFALLGKSSDLTGRGDIWAAVIGLAEQRPVQGWGWVSYWVPWVKPFDTLAFEGGVRQLHAHNAWLDIWLQLGVIGLVIFGGLVLGVLLRSWVVATNRPVLSTGAPGVWNATSLLPLLVMVALLVQSITESRLIVEYGLALLVYLAVSLKREWNTVPGAFESVRQPTERI